MSNDPDLLDEWIVCRRCKGTGTVLDRDGEVDVDCPVCDGEGGWER